MKILLDWKSTLWFISGDPRLPPSCIDIIRNPSNQVYVSAAGLLKMMHAVSRGLVRLHTLTLAGLVQRHILDNKIDILPIKLSHILRALRLSVLPLGPAPVPALDELSLVFVAQTLVEGIPILGGDRRLDSYLATRRLKRYWQ